MSDQSTALRDALRALVVRDLRAVERQIAAYPDDQSIWQTPAGISNSAGTLALHIAGNLRHFFGAVLGRTGYVRNRDAEFSTRGLSRAALQAEVRAAIADIEETLNGLDPAQLEAAYPIPVAERKVRTGDYLVHLAVHLTYHLGQIDYHRRLLTPNPQPVESLSTHGVPAYDGAAG